jgi:ubiquinone/menaquinone biosynthesis C-methylase UbiE
MLKPTWEKMHLDGYNNFSGNLVTHYVLEPYIKFLENKNVLDIGCGGGDGFLWMKDTVAGYTGTDISEESCRKTKLKHQAHSAFKDAIPCDGDGNLPFSDKEFSVVFSMLVFQHIHKDFILRYMQEANRVLVNGGKVLIHTTEWEHQYQGENNVLEPYENNNALSGQYSHNYDVMSKIFDQCGFRILAFERKQNYTALIAEKAHWLVYFAEKK